MDFWIGLRASTVIHKYDPSAQVPLIEKNNSLFSYADGTSFDVNKGYLLGATKLSGECIFLKQSTAFGVSDSKCNKLKGFICQWSSEYNKSISNPCSWIDILFCEEPSCPTGYAHMGQVSDGRTCFGTPVTTAVSSSVDTCPATLIDLLRSRWIPNSSFAVDRFRRLSG